MEGGQSCLPMFCFSGSFSPSKTRETAMDWSRLARKLPSTARWMITAVVTTAVSNSNCKYPDRLRERNVMMTASIFSLPLIRPVNYSLFTDLATTLYSVDRSVCQTPIFQGQIVIIGFLMSSSSLLVKVVLLSRAQKQQNPSCWKNQSPVFIAGQADIAEL